MLKIITLHLIISTRAFILFSKKNNAFVGQALPTNFEIPLKTRSNEDQLFTGAIRSRIVVVPPGVLFLLVILCPFFLYPISCLVFLVSLYHFPPLFYLHAGRYQCSRKAVITRQFHRMEHSQQDVETNNKITRQKSTSFLV